MNGISSNNELDKDVEYRTKEIKETLRLAPHVVVVEPYENSLGRKVLRYSKMRSYDKVKKMQQATFVNGKARYIGNYKGFLLQVNSGSVRVNYSSDERDNLDGAGINLTEGDICSITDIDLRVLQITALTENASVDVGFFY